jgi:hypothetical protein
MGIRVLGKVYKDFHDISENSSDLAFLQRYVHFTRA